MKTQPTLSPDPSALPLLCIGDITGSVSNFGTILPLFFAVSLTSGMSISLMLLLCGIWYILTGVLYRIPIPVEPLKAVAAISIAGHLTQPVIAASGILTGLLFLSLGFSKCMGWIQGHIPSPVIRGIQLGLGLVLLKSAVLDFGIHDTVFFPLCILILILFVVIRMRRDIPDISALTILAIGAGVLVYSHGMPVFSSPDLPEVTIPGLSDFLTGGVNLFIPQIPLTMANSILATSLIAGELFSRQVSPDKLSVTVGAMSLSTAVLGGFPLCHGAGGVAAHYRFGARSGSAMVIGGIILICLSTLLTNPTILSGIPKGIFGTLLLAVAVELIKGGIKTDNLLVSSVMAVIAVPAGMAAAFIVGILVSAIIPLLSKRTEQKIRDKRS